MTGYASEQFYNFGESYEKGTSIKRAPDDNPNFIWPRPIQPDVYNPIRGRQLVDTRLQRGFIRGIYPSLLGGNSNPSANAVKKRRLFFQFNPETIDRTVQMNAMVANPLLQDPSQLFQPVAGTAAFSFDLLFNREAEVVSAQYATSQLQNGGYVTDTASSLTSPLDIYGGKYDGKGVDYKQSDVANLGVLADMYVLDSIIGQSITPDLIGFLKNYFNTASTAVSNYNSSVGGASISAFNPAGFETTVSKNFGNSAFLSPLPIRIVFSSLFMVEGFVETSSVQFVKFTKNYVPTICKVTLNIRALYIGFAKEEAYLTTSLKTAVADVKAQQAQDLQRLAVAQDAAKYDIKFTYTTPKFDKNYADDSGTWTYSPTISTFASIQEYWNAGIWPPGTADPSGGASFKVFPYSGAGEVRSWVTGNLAKEVAAGNISWTLDTTFQLDEVDNVSKIVVKNLFKSPVKYLLHNTSGDNYRQDAAQVTNETIVANALKANTQAKARKNKYWVSLPDERQTGLPVISSASSLLRITITNTITLTVQTLGGPQTVTHVVSDYVDINGISSGSNNLVNAINGAFTLTLAKNRNATGWKDLNYRPG